MGRAHAARAVLQQGAQRSAAAAARAGAARPLDDTGARCGPAPPESCFIAPMSCSDAAPAASAQATCAACLTWSSSPPARTAGRCRASRAPRWWRQWWRTVMTRRSSRTASTSSGRHSRPRAAHGRWMRAQSASRARAASSPRARDGAWMTSWLHGVTAHPRRVLCATSGDEVVLNSDALPRVRRAWRLRPRCCVGRPSSTCKVRSITRASYHSALLTRDVIAGADRWLHAFSVRELPKSPSERFKALFAERPRWTRDEIEPYLAVRPACAR